MENQSPVRFNMFRVESLSLHGNTEAKNAHLLIDIC
jgi:hypothetical protein